MEKEHECCGHSKQDNSKNYLMLAMVAIILIASVVQAFQINSIKKEFSGSNAAGNISLSASSNDSTSNAGGETYDEMMARMHPGLAQQTTQTSSSSQMVGGC